MNIFLPKIWIYGINILLLQHEQTGAFLEFILEKGTKQYKGEIETDRQILNKYIQGGQEDDKA